MNGSIGNGHSAGLDAADATAQHPLMKVCMWMTYHASFAGSLADCVLQIPPIREFDAFPKTLSTYKSRSSRGGVLTLLLSAAILFLVWHELREYLFGDPEYSFAVDKGVAHQLQINVDMTIAMPCHCECGLLTVLTSIFVPSQADMVLSLHSTSTSPDSRCSRRSRRQTAHFGRIQERGRESPMLPRK